MVEMEMIYSGNSHCIVVKPTGPKRADNFTQSSKYFDTGQSK